MNTADIPNDFNDVTVLIADDQESVRFYYESILEPTGLNLLLAKNGQEAFEIFRRHNHIDLILLDLRMPVMNGIETMKLMRGFDQEVMIVAQSAFTMTEDVNAFKEMGFHDFIAKPIDEDRLMELIQESIKNRK